MGRRDKLDHYSLKAQKEGYPARSVYKLEEIQNKFKILKPGQKIIDVGAAPGSWTMYALKITQGKGLVVGADLKPLNLKKTYPNLFFMQGDVFKEETVNFLCEKGPFDVVLSDAAPSTTGNRLTDTSRSYDLVLEILNLADNILKPGGSAVFKIFQGEDSKLILDRMKLLFNDVKTFKPKSVRSESFETYFIGLNKK
ncbi:RlmE family RNA methyltransferase [Thiospirochaeta perfilievii]|uniref:Ribosomal RNA large subunit methyltransferase E n=1 Tax=Thiospirochaeta perfilievii TaxID=252967 RepID=A0A5C1Q9F6_9SPIO|nr:RlmE family RNA methyltransferase [Thiospirochaeta perfilievii]QEN04773.1 RlmE family RNA methyltransferase [Thiospirochaeta perfilievii]